MATSGELVKMIAVETGYPEPTVAIVARKLREAGLLTKGGRGRSAAHMSPLDAARLVLAFLVTESPGRAVEAVTDFGSMRAQRTDQGDRFEGLDIHSLYGAPADPMLEDVIAHIIAGFSDDEVLDELDKHAYTIANGMAYIPPIIVEVYDTLFSAQVRVGSSQTTFYPDETTRMQWLDADKWHRGIRSARSITASELGRIGQFIAGLEVYTFEDEVADQIARVQEASKTEQRGEE